jgi:toxin ParE1/3/4
VKRLLFSPQFDADWEGIAGYLDLADPELAMRLAKDLDQAIARISQWPDAGTPWESGNPRLGLIRIRRLQSFSNYLLFYQCSGEIIQVLRIVHAAQDWQNSFQD